MLRTDRRTNLHVSGCIGTQLDDVATNYNSASFIRSVAESFIPNGRLRV